MAEGCRGWVCKFRAKEIGGLKHFFYPIRIKVLFLEENEVTPGPVSVAELATEEPKEDMEIPESHMGLYMILGLVGLGLMICVIIGLKKLCKFCKFLRSL